MGIEFAEESVVIAATPGECFSTITDYASFTGWQKAVKRVEVLDEAPDGATVRFTVDAKVREINYVLRYAYEHPARITWDYIEGDVASIEGSYRFEPEGNGTVATYRVGLDPGFPVPGFVMRRAASGLISESVAELKRETERRAKR